VQTHELRKVADMVSVELEKNAPHAAETKTEKGGLALSAS
jgi:hypothetical protein